MANVINLGAYPINEGSPSENKSLYIGNNRFVRILSQTSPNRLIAVMSESTDVYSETQTITNIHEQIIYSDRYFTNFKLEKLSNGNILIIGNDMSASGTMNKIVVLSYDDVNDQFSIEHEHIITSTMATQLPDFNAYIFAMYGDDTMIIIGVGGARLLAGRINGISTGNDNLTYVSYVPANFAYDDYFRENSATIDIIDDKAYATIGSEDSYQGFCFDLLDDSTLILGRGFCSAFTKLDTDRYVLITYDPSKRLQYTISPTYAGNNSDQSSPSYIAPLFDIGVTTDDYVVRDIIPLDRQHLIFFYKPENQSGIYAAFFNILDENYGFVSDNSTTGNGIFVCDVTSTISSFGNFHTGKLVHTINSTQFWIQTNDNEFAFLTMSAS